MTPEVPNVWFTYFATQDAAGTLPPGVPSHWAVYFAVTDTGATARRTVELGGHVYRGAEDTPSGRIATLSDPTGAMFRVRQVDH